MNSWMIAVWIVAVVACLIAIGVSLLSFVRYPLQRATGSLLAILTVLAGNLFLPSFEGTAAVSVNLRLFAIQGATLNFATGDQVAHTIVAFVSVGACLAICLFRLPTKAAV